MARGSGVATDGLIPGAFHHTLSSIDYRVFLRDGAAWMTYTRPASSPQGALSGEQQLLYYIGSGHRGRTYLFQQNGQWFELPINFYTRRNTWAMAPAFDNATSMPAPLPVDPNCLHCHATDVQPSLPTARSRFANIPFHQGGIGCSSCHGDPTQHLAAKGHAPIVNPAKLSPARRDSSCIQCHLEGNAVVYRPGKSLSQFKPGDDLADFAVYFVRSHEDGDGRRATSQYEALLRSACKRASGDKLTCTTCHDPHYDPTPAERVQYFRTRCLQCHSSPAMATHHAEQPDCAKCHMPSRSTTDISHEQVTDHDIEAQPAGASSHLSLHNLEATSTDELVPVGSFPASDREYGLAYAQEALKGDRHAAELSLNYLTKAFLAGANDPELNVRLGYLQQINDEPAKARASYTAALNVDPYEPAALANLAVLDASSAHLPEAINLLERLIDNDPTQTAAGLNLAYIDCKLGRQAQAHNVLQQLQRANPDSPQLRDYINTGNYAGSRCLVQ
ncbi:tetratricopeptide repeat protein [Granulicella sp. 5B5]|nr:tetratricopeptide repeat protein [Granulicella sp. 5B5]